MKAASSSKSSKNVHKFIALLIFIAGLVIAVVIVYLQSVSNFIVLRNADPAMIALAQQAGMSRVGELVFLRADPILATDSQMRLDCAGNAAANNKNGFIEQGCFVPQATNRAAGHIFIRQMPANLYDQEIVTAAYEMLHSVYFSITSSSSNTNLVQAIESNYNVLHNTSLDAQVTNFASTEPGYRDLELFSLLGTEYTQLSPNLEAYYSQFFYNRALTTAAYTRVSSTFQSEQAQLTQFSKNIASDQGLANTAYADSIAWANAGNAYEDSYNYTIYKNYIVQANAAISAYDQLSQEYNTLVTAYNGSQPVNTITSIPTQAAK